MAETRKIVKAFLASPGDLQEERKAVRSAIDEFNETWADELGYQIDLMGYEDTIPGFGRPQHLINQDLDKCDLFIGMMWKRWGTPPDILGKYTSGFHEEFERSLERRRRDGKPEIGLFFKEIDSEYLKDPGPDLQKVIEFKQGIVDGKIILYQKFLDIGALETLIRKSISTYINRIKKAEENIGADEDLAKQTKTRSATGISMTSTDISSPFSAEGFNFLKSFVDRIRNDATMEGLNSCDIARFRLLSNSISKPGNHEEQMGVHDINLLYSNREHLNFGKRELFSLLRFGLQYMQHENTPLWYWYSKRNRKNNEGIATLSWVSDNDSEKIGAINALTLLGADLPDNEKIKRNWFIESWFSENASTNIKNAALEYLGRNGILSDFSAVKKEYERNDNSTSRKALENMIRLLYRNGAIGSAEGLVLETQFDSFDSPILQVALENFKNVDSKKLMTGLDHRNSAVRLNALRVLRQREQLSDELVEKLAKDSSAAIRNEALAILIDKGKLVSNDEARNILVRTSGFGAQGQAYFDEFLSKRLNLLSEPDLIKKVSEGSVFDDAPYFTLCDKYFSKHAKKLRADVDDQFKSYFNDRLARIRIFADDDLIQKTKDLEDFMCRKFMRKGLDILCEKRRLEDINRVRENLRKGYVEASIRDVEYFEKYGEWDDIELLANAKEPGPVGSLLSAVGHDYNDAVAKVAYKIGKNSISKLLMLKLPQTIIQKILYFCSDDVIKNISDDVLFSLLNNEGEGVRKAAAMVVVRAFPVNRIRIILDQYISGEKYRYYNVIHWLDLGASMPRYEAKTIVLTASGYNRV